ncbi:MAG: preprotein translocase subunit SecG [Patescibacteria group bacterium]
MKNIILIAQAIVSVLLIVLILLQNTKEEGRFNLSLLQPKFSRRGLEKVTFIATIVCLGLFLILSFWQLLI